MVGGFLRGNNWSHVLFLNLWKFQGRIGRPIFHHLWWHGPKCHLTSPKCLGKLWHFFAFVFLWASLRPFLHTPSSCLDLPNCSSVNVHLLCYAPDSQPKIFTQKFDEYLQCFLQFCLLLAVLISLRQWHFLFPKKNFSPTCKLLFSS